MTRKSKPITNPEKKVPQSGDWRGESLRLLILVLIPLLIYAQTFHFPFINYDDFVVAKNDHLYAGLTWDNLYWAFTSFDFVMYLPLMWVSHMLEIELWGGTPGVFHAGNVILHIANTLLLYACLRAMTGAPLRSAFVAAMFAAHPLHVESVAWIADRKDLLSTFFLLLSLMLYIRYTRRSTFWLLGASWFCYLLAMLSKPMVVTFPCLLLLLDFWPLRRWSGFSDDIVSSPSRPPARSWQRLLLEKLPFFALLPLAYMSAVVGHELDSERVIWSHDPLAFSYRLLNAIYVYGAYLWHTIWPLGLAIHYPHPRENISLPLVALSGIVLIGISILALWQWKRRPYLIVGWLWYLGSLFPVIKIVEFGGPFHMADRYTYIPLVGIFIAGVWLVADWAADQLDRLKLTCTGGSVLLIIWTVLSIQQTALWQSSESLMRHALAVTKNNDKANYLLADALLHENNLAEAVPYLEQTIAITPDSPRALHMLGQVYYQLGQPDKAVAPLTELVKQSPNEPAALHDLGLVLLDIRRYEPALEYLQQAFELDRENPQFRETLLAANVEYGAHQLDTNHWQQSLKLFEHALALDSSCAEAYSGLGVAYAKLGQRDQALSFFQRAVQLDPHNPRYAQNLKGIKAASAIRISRP